MNEMAAASLLSLARKATPADAPRVFDMFMSNMSSVTPIEMEPEETARSVDAAINEGRVFVVERAGEIVGCAGYELLKFWYSSKVQMWDQGIVVSPCYRHTRVADMLRVALETESELLGKSLMISASAKSQEAIHVMNKRYPKVAEIFVVRA